MDANFEAAYRLMTSPQARDAFDLSKEPQEVREKYGMNRFGQCCLLARRLIEAGVRFVTVNTFLTVFNEITWDIHGSKPFTSIEGMKNIVAPMYDQALRRADRRPAASAACWTTRWSATWPSSAARRGSIPAGGRDHWPQCFTRLLRRRRRARAAASIGKSDAIGAYPAERAVDPPRSRRHDLQEPRLRPRNRAARPRGPAVPAGGFREA